MINIQERLALVLYQVSKLKKEEEGIVTRLHFYAIVHPKTKNKKKQQNNNTNKTQNT